MSWLPFAIAAPLLYGVTNFFDKYLIEKRVPNPLLLTVMSGAVPVSFGLIAWAVLGFPGMPVHSALILIGSGCIFQWALIPYYKALQYDDTSRITPLFQIIPVYALILSTIFLGERLHGSQILGFCVVLLGGIALSVERLEQGFLKLRKSFWLMMFSSIFYTLPIVFFKSVEQPFWHSLVFEFFGFGVGSALLLLLPSIRQTVRTGFPKIPKTTWLPIFINEVIYISGKLCTFYATTLAAVALVTVMGAFQPLFVLLLGLGLTLAFPHIIKEDIRRSTFLLKAAATVVVIVGVIIMNAS